MTAPRPRRRTLQGWPHPAAGEEVDVQQLQGLGWRVTSPAAIRRVLADQRLSAATPDVLLTQLGFGETRFAREVLSWFLYRDEPDHSRLRRVVQVGFSGKAVARLEATVVEEAGRLVRSLPTIGTADLAELLCEPLASWSIGRLLGTPESADAALSRAGRTVLAALGMPTTASVAAAESALDDIAAVVVDTLASPGTGLLHELGDRSSTVSFDELVTTAALVVLGGQGTTRDLLANAIVRALGEPGLWAALCADLGRADDVVREVLRLEPSVGFGARVAPFAMEVEGVSVGAGELVWCDLGEAGRLAGERDGDDGTRFDIDRPEVPLVAFGHGAHHCIGAALARSEVRAGLQALANLRPDTALAVPADAVAWIPSMIYRGRAEVPVLLGERASVVRP